MTQPNLDPVSVVAALAATLIGAQAAPIVAAYSIIIFAWVGGVIVGLYRRDPESRMPAWAFIFVTFVITLGLTTAASTALGPRTSLDPGALFFPVAFMIPAVGDNWPGLIKWAWNTWKNRGAAGKEQP